MGGIKKQKLEKIKEEEIRKISIFGDFYVKFFKFFVI